MITFKDKGINNTEAAAELAVQTARERGYDIVTSTNTGSTVDVLLKEAEKQGYTGKIIAVTHVYGMREANTNEMSDEKRAELTARGVTVVTAGHALSAGERGLSSVFKGVYPLELIAHTLRMFGAGTKVCVECALMAADCGSVKTGSPVVCVGGTGRGADTVTIIIPATSAHLLDLKVSEFIAKPSLLEG